MTSRPGLNPRVDRCACIRCGAALPVADHFEGCPVCAGQGQPASVRAVYDRHPDRLAEPAASGCRRYADWLVYTDWPSLGEGGTPVIDLPRLAGPLGLGRLAVKYEGANPTGSHKDRMSMLAVARALDVGAKTVVAASSGNAGVSLAAYAGAAGLEAVVVTTPKITPNWRRAIEMCGGRLVAAGDSLERWHYVKRQVDREGWFPVTNHLVPPVGSNWIGVDGYRTIAFELHEQLDAGTIDAVIVPTARADLMWGICRGFRDLKEAGLIETVPAVHAVEPFPRIAAVLDGADPRGQFPGETRMASIAGTTVAYQALDALNLCGGTAVAVDDAAAREDQHVLARSGIYLELSCAAALTALRRLVASGVVAPDASVVLMGTAHGFKEHETFDHPIPLIG